MNKKVELDISEMKRVFYLLEKFYSLLQKPRSEMDENYLESFMRENYMELNDVYYDMVWNWLPSDES